MAVILGSPGIYLGGASVPPVPPFVNEYSMSFDGIGDYIYAGTSSLGITGGISVSAWVKIPTTNTGGASAPYVQVIACEDTTSGGQRNWTLAWRGTGFNYFQWSVFAPNGASTTVASSGVVPNDNQWHHLLGTFDGTTGTNGVKLYVDGSLSSQATASFAGLNSGSTDATVLGATIKPNESLNFNADAVNNFFTTFTYDPLTSELLFIYVS